MGYTGEGFTRFLYKPSGYCYNDSEPREAIAGIRKDPDDIRLRNFIVGYPSTEPERRKLMKNTKEKLRVFCILAVLSGLIFLLGLTPLGLIPLGFVNVTILCVPVIVGALYTDAKHGLILGFVFGLVSFISALIKPSALVSTLMGASPLLTALMCFLPRLTVPLTAWGVCRMLGGKKEIFRLAAAAVCGSLTNTILYLGLMLLFYVMAGLDTAGVLKLIGGIALIAGGCEAVFAGIVCPPILIAVKRIR